MKTSESAPHDAASVPQQFFAFPKNEKGGRPTPDGASGYDEQLQNVFRGPRLNELFTFILLAVVWGIIFSNEIAVKYGELVLAGGFVSIYAVIALFARRVLSPLRQLFYFTAGLLFTYTALNAPTITLVFGLFFLIVFRLDTTLGPRTTYFGRMWDAFRAFILCAAGIEYLAGIISLFFPERTKPEMDRARANTIRMHIVYIALACCISLPVLIILYHANAALAHVVNTLFSWLYDLLFNFINAILWSIGIFVFLLASRLTLSRLSLVQAHRITFNFKSLRDSASMVFFYTLLALNILFLFQNVTDVVYIWITGRPETLTAAEHLHAGFYGLLAAIGVGGIIIITFFRLLTDENTTLKRLPCIFLYVYLGQMFFLIISMLIRSLRYIHNFGMTPLRFELFVFLILTLFAVAIMLVGVARRRDIAFIEKRVFHLYFWPLLLMLGCFNVGAFAADYFAQSHVLPSDWTQSRAAYYQANNIRPYAFHADALSQDDIVALYTLMTQASDAFSDTEYCMAYWTYKERYDYAVGSAEDSYWSHSLRQHARYKRLRKQGLPPAPSKDVLLWHERHAY